MGHFFYPHKKENMSLKKLAALAALALATSAASAQTAKTDFYGEVAFTSTTYKASNLSGSWSPSALRGVVGMGFHENFAVEGMLLVGAADSSNLGVNLKLTSGAGLYLKPRAKLGDSVEVFARLGWANVNSKVGNIDTKDNGASYGLGGSFSLNKTTSLNVDYMLYNDQNGAKIDGVSVGVGFKF